MEAETYMWALHAGHAAVARQRALRPATRPGPRVRERRHLTSTTVRARHAINHSVPKVTLWLTMQNATVSKPLEEQLEHYVMIPRTGSF